MSLDMLTSKYIVSAEKVLKEMQRAKGSITINEECIDNIVEHVEAYLADA